MNKHYGLAFGSKIQYHGSVIIQHPRWWVKSISQHMSKGNIWALKPARVANEEALQSRSSKLCNKHLKKKKKKRSPHLYEGPEFPSWMLYGNIISTDL